MPPARVAVVTACTLALWLASAGCDGSSPTEPDLGLGPSQVVFADPAALAAQQAAITSLLEDTLDRAATELPVDSVLFTVFADAARSIPGWGLGGYTLSGFDVDIVVDPEFPGLDAVLPDRLPPIAAHELHHTVRWRGVGPYSTLLEALVFEGLADHFAAELLGTPLQPWSQAFPENQTDDFLERARPEFDSPTFDFEAWFFGFGTDLPTWTGYTLGYRIVRDYMETNPGLSAADLVDTPAEAFRPD